MSTLFELYKNTKKALEASGIDEADAEARLIAEKVSGHDFSYILLHGGEETVLTAEEIIRKRVSGVPLAYILREKYFFGRSFYVDENVLIPRYDTEIIASEAINIIKAQGIKTALDLCCGSGCIGVTLALETGARVLGADIDENAVEISNRNAKALGAAFTAVKSDIFEGIEGKFGVIVSNPPYVTEEEYAELSLEVRDYEPQKALLGGLSFYERIAKDAAEHLTRGGFLLFEIGMLQGNAVFDILKKRNYENIRIIPDLAGRDRVVVCTKS